jgi:putative transposase
MHVSNLYVLRKKYDAQGIEGLVKCNPSGGAGKSRLDNAIEGILIESIKEHYLTKQKKSVARVIEAVEALCYSAKVSPPSRNTVYRRCYAIVKLEAIKKREGRKAAKAYASQTFDGYQEATRPLEIIQIDHTLMDIIVVHAETRQPIGRAWLTIAIDVFSRMVFGFHVSLDPPSAMSSALCLQQAIIMKDKWLAERGINHSWGIYGMPEALHMDNGKDFHSRTLRCGCEKHEIDMHYRPVAQPEFGAHVERLIGTFMTEMKALPGATFSNIVEKGEYDSEKESAMTLAEVEKWLATLITGKYHKRRHSALQMSPEQKFLEGLQGSGNTPSAGINRIIVDEAALLMDFTPYFVKTVQNYGIRLDNIHYNSPELKRFVNAVDLRTSGKRKFIVRRDPRDISVLYFYDPDAKRYITVPYRKRSHPKMSLFELRIVLARIEERGKIDKVTEDEIFRTYAELKAIEDPARKETKKARRNQERLKIQRLSTSANKPPSMPPVATHNDELEADVDLDAFEVEPC